MAVKSTTENVVQFSLSCPEQGVALESLDPKEALEWATKEMSLFQSVESVIAGQLNVFNSNINSGPFIPNIRARVSAVQEAARTGNTSVWADYAERAKQRELIIWQGTVGQTVHRWAHGGKHLEARWLTYVHYSGALDEGSRNMLAPFRALTLGSPLMESLGDVTSAELAREKAERALEDVRKTKIRIDDWEADSREAIERLRVVYEDKLALGYPTKVWKAIKRRQTVAWQVWGAVFTGLVVLPLLAIFLHWPTVSEAIIKVTTGGTGGAFSLGGVAAISVPTLFYAWLLKNVSRLFIQALNVSNDAEHREALTNTFLALARNKRLEMKEAERALILNALFRPAAMQSLDEGPPAGLVELIKGK